ncbi:MAG: recombinase family protein [Alcaligenaceae bacterium]|nr:MAG: recombinase family protein [Alcaligenaceae bacterium]
MLLKTSTAVFIERQDAPAWVANSVDADSFQHCLGRDLAILREASNMVAPLTRERMMAKHPQQVLKAQSLVRAAEYVRMSTDHQKYSTLNQSALIHAYAEAHGMEVVTTYADPGKSGLTLKSRPGLSLLLSDVLAGKAQFEVVLVYDISRWGRFQDADESAHYEFICRRAGIRVVYCAEQFGADSTPLASVLKALKRAMAGEYSRELSVKVAIGKKRIASLGFRVGGIPGYGLRRQVLQEGRTPGLILHEGQRKSIQTDRVTLVPGPADELDVIRRIYRDYIYLRKGERRIAQDLNDEGLTCQGRPWSRNHVRTILANEKYVGESVLGRTSQPLRATVIRNPPEQWICHKGAFEPVVSLATFKAAASVRRFNEKTFVSERDLLEALRAVLKREGKLTTQIIDADPSLPSANTVQARFGTITKAYERLGYLLRPRYVHHAVERALKAVRGEVHEALLRSFRKQGITCSVSDRGVITVDTAITVEVRVCRHQQPRPYSGGWRIRYLRTLETSHVLAARMMPGNEALKDFLLIPSGNLAQLPLFIKDADDEQLATFAVDALDSAVATLVKS